MKKNFGILAAVCLLFSMVLPVYAKEEKVLAGFGLGEKLYIFLEADKEEEIQVSLEGMPLQGERRESVRLAESGQQVHYFLLLDRSTSMEKYREQTIDFVTELYEYTEGKKSLTLLSFGDAFEREVEAAVDENTVLKRLQEISCDEQRTNLYKGICSALDYIEGLDRKRGDLYQIILITDGVPYEASEVPTAEEMEERVEEAKDVAFATLGFGSTEDFQTFKMGNGLWMAGADEEVSTAAEEMAQKVNGLYTVCFDMSGITAGDPLDIVLFFPETKETVRVGGVPVFAGGAQGQGEESSFGNLSEKGKQPKEEETEEEIRTEEMPSEEEGTEEKTEEEMQAEETPLEEKQRGEKTQVEEANSEEGQTGENESDREEDGQAYMSAEKHKGAIQLIVYMLIFMGGIALGGGIVIAVRKGNQHSDCRKKSGAPGVRRGQQGICLRVEVISGRCLTKRRSFSVEQDLLIGRGKMCGLVWDEEDVSEKNTRIFVRNGKVYIEDMGSPYGTAVNGMRIYAPNPLRDGDMVSIGRIQFRILL